MESALKAVATKAELKGEMRQISQRLSNLEQGAWVLGILISAWITLMLAILFKG